jgi:hypothetical protein
MGGRLIPGLSFLVEAASQRRYDRAILLCLVLSALMNFRGTAVAQGTADSVFTPILLSAQEEHGADTTGASATDKLLYLGGASLLFAGIDYFGFNLTRRNDTHLAIYRVFQVLTQAAITWFLYDKLGLPTAIGFNLIWWTFGVDFLYYGYAELINPGHPWESRGDLKSKVFDHDANWAWWTPVGIARGMRRTDGISGDTLVAQSLVGAALGIAITVTF